MTIMSGDQIEAAGQRIMEAFETLVKDDPPSKPEMKIIVTEAMTLLLNLANDANRIAFALEQIAMNTQPRG